MQHQNHVRNRAWNHDRSRVLTAAVTAAFGIAGGVAGALAAPPASAAGQLKHVHHQHQHDQRQQQARQHPHQLAEHAASEDATQSALSFTVKTIDGDDKPLHDYAGKVILVVNVASKCGHTKQYAGLQALYEQYKDQGLVILGFPANNYRNQEPGTNEEILEFCTRRYNVTFDMFAKVSAKGEDISPFLKYLTEHAPDDNQGTDIRWNFEKFLIDREGNVINRFRSKVQPMDKKLVRAVEAAL